MPVAKKWNLKRTTTPQDVRFSSKCLSLFGEPLLTANSKPKDSRRNWKKPKIMQTVWRPLGFLLLRRETLSKVLGYNKRQTQCKCTLHSRQTFVHGGIELEFDSDDISSLCKRRRKQMLSTENRSIQGSQLLHSSRTSWAEQEKRHN